MALRSTAALSAINGGLRRLFSTTATASSDFLSSITSSTNNTPGRPQAEPNTNLFVSGLNKRTTTSEKLREAFTQFGEVVHARVVTDRVSGYSKGFGFVQYATLQDAAKGIEGMDGKFLDGWVIFAEYAKPRPPPENNNSSPGYGTNSMAPPYGYNGGRQ